MKKNLSANSCRMISVPRSSCSLVPLAASFLLQPRSSCSLVVSFWLSISSCSFLFLFMWIHMMSEPDKRGLLFNILPIHCDVPQRIHCTKNFYHDLIIISFSLSNYLDKTSISLVSKEAPPWLGST